MLLDIRDLLPSLLIVTCAALTFENAPVARCPYEPQRAALLEALRTSFSHPSKASRPQSIGVKDKKTARARANHPCQDCRCDTKAISTVT